MISCKIKVLPVAADCCLPRLLLATATIAAAGAAPVFVAVIHHLHTTASACHSPLVRLTPAPVAIGMAADCCTAADVYLILFIHGRKSGKIEYGLWLALQLVWCWCHQVVLKLQYI